MRKWIITGALLANALLGGLVLLLVWDGGGWGEAVRLSETQARVLVVVAAVALILNLVLAPVLGVSFWARDRGTRKLETRLAASQAQRHDEPAVPGGPIRHPVHEPADQDRGGSAAGAGNLGDA